MKKIKIFTSATFLLIATFSLQTSNAQTIELLGGNTLNGAFNGVLLGGATMALQNSDDFAPVRVGLGAGTLYGISVGIYDVSTTGPGQQFYISGVFNDGTNTSILVLLDTIYGAAGGAIVASSISLIAQDPVVDALQYGSGVGAWVGFGFGLMDAFILSSRPGSSQQASIFSGSNQQQVDGLITYTNAKSNLGVGLISPSIISTKEISSIDVGQSISPSIDILQLNIKL